jgi:hypothetical protein
LITEQGYEEQAQSYLNMESAADMAASAEKKAATGADIAAGFQFAAGLASLFTGGVGGTAPDPTQKAGTYFTPGTPGYSAGSLGGVY